RSAFVATVRIQSGCVKRPMPIAKNPILMRSPPGQSGSLTLWPDGCQRQNGEEAKLEAAIDAWAAIRPADPLAAALQAGGVPSYGSASDQGLAEDEQLTARGAFVELPHAEVGERRHVGAPCRFSQSRVRGRARRSTPLRRHRSSAGGDPRV